VNRPTWTDLRRPNDFRGVWTDNETVVHAREAFRRWTVCGEWMTRDGVVTFAGHLQTSNLCPDCVRLLRGQGLLT